MFAASGGDWSDLLQGLLVLIFLVGGTLVTKIVEWLKKREAKKAEEAARQGAPMPTAGQQLPAEQTPPPPTVKPSALEEMLKEILAKTVRPKEVPTPPVQKKRREKPAEPPPEPPVPVPAAPIRQPAPALAAAASIETQRPQTLSLDERLFRNRPLTPLQRAVVLSDVFGAPAAMHDSRYEFRSTL